MKSGKKVDSLFYQVRLSQSWKVYSNHDQIVLRIDNIELPKIFYTDCNLYTSNAWVECGNVAELYRCSDMIAQKNFV